MTSTARRFPAEWEPQSAILLAWPHDGTDWADRLAEVEDTYIALVAAITRFQDVVLITGDEDVQAYARARLSSARVEMERVRFVEAPYDDTWLRDSGPITLRDGASFDLLDFRFTGWGGKFEAGRDDALVETLGAAGVFRDAIRTPVDFALEGGAIETDGNGTLLTTWRCLHERHPGQDRSALTQVLTTTLAQDRVLWLDHGALEGDDTDAHIDTLARFASADSIVYQGCDDPDDAHYEDLQAMASELTALRAVSGHPYRLFELPWAPAVVDDGRRLAASYANFLIVNGAVLMPVYGVDEPSRAADQRAQMVMAAAFPDREIVPVFCRPLIWQNGSLHCLTMQLPSGVLAAL